MLPASLWLPCVTHLYIVLARCLTRTHSSSDINITIPGTFLLVPTRASGSLASLSVIQTHLLCVFHNLFIIDLSNTVIVRGRGRDGAETRLADTVDALVCLAPASTRCRRARHAALGPGGRRLAVTVTSLAGGHCGP
jgi:hypothetical protein